MYIPSYESFGRMWPHMHVRVLAALVIYQITMLGYISLKKFLYAPFIVPLPILSVVFAYICNKRFYRAFANTSLEVACQNLKETSNLESVYTAFIPPSLMPEKLDDGNQFEGAQSQPSRPTAV